MSIITDAKICQCTADDLSITNGNPLENSEVSMLGYLRSHSKCSTAHFSKEFPSQCPAIYRELLPRVGYPNPSERFVSEA